MRGVREYTQKLLRNLDDLDPDIEVIKVNAPLDHIHLIIVRQASELGVSHIVPIISERTEKKGFNMERAKKILREASEQPLRDILPVLHDPTDLPLALSTISFQAIAFHTDAPTLSRERLNVS